MFKKVMGLILAVTILASAGMTVFANDNDDVSGKAVKDTRGIIWYSYNFDVDPGDMNKYVGPMDKGNTETYADLRVESTLNNQPVFYRICNAKSTNAFISETKSAYAPIDFTLQFNSGYAKPQSNLYLRAYVSASGAWTIHSGMIII